MNKCYKCGFELGITKKPKSCPRCKTRLDYIFKEKIQPKPKEEEVHIIDEKKDTLKEQRKKYLEE